MVEKNWVMSLARVEDYYDVERFTRIVELTKEIETPFLVVDLDMVQEAYDKLVTFFPIGKVYYAVKANPDPAVLRVLAARGSSFDVASRYELQRLLESGVPASRMLFGNTIKKRADIGLFYAAGVRLYTTDSEMDLINVAEMAPGSKIFVRIQTEGSSTADWPLSRKFGCHGDMAIDLIVQAAKLGLVPYGISFHVGSQQREIGAWKAAISKVQGIFDVLSSEYGIKLNAINIGGGFPANYKTRTNPLSLYIAEIMKFLVESFGEGQIPEIILEPGRSLVGDSGILISEVVMVSRKSNTSIERWVYLDVGKFSGLAETMDESIKYPIWVQTHPENITECHQDDIAMEKVILAGPTCDSADILYENYKYQLPINIKPKERVFFFSAGAYTASYSSVEFNGFPPLPTYCT